MTRTFLECPFVVAGVGFAPAFADNMPSTRPRGSMNFSRRTFPFPVEPADLFQERGHQMQSWGIPAATLSRVKSKTREMWKDAPGGWAYEWNREAQAAEEKKRWYEAAMCYGAAKFPSVSTELQKRTYEKQLDCYLRAAPDFPCSFQRIEVNVPYREGQTSVPVHLFAPKRVDKLLPLVCLSGGVDTLKMELHRLALAIALLGRFRVAAIDMPGTGESEVPLAGDAHVVYQGVLAHLRNGAKTGVWGVSFGGHWAAKLACLSAVDAAVDMGGPIGTKILDDSRLPNGMTGIVANALGLEAFLSVSSSMTSEISVQFSLNKQGLLTRRTSSPLLIFNGARDPYIPIEDTTAFIGWQNTRVWLFERGDHCAANHIKRVVPAAVAWLRSKLCGETAVQRWLASAAERLLPRRTYPDRTSSMFAGNG